MRRLSPRQWVLVGALVLAGLVWAADALTRGGPAPAQAAAAGGSAPAPIAEWAEVERMVERLTRREYESVAEALATLDRDLFVPTDAAAQVLTAAGAAPEPESQQVSEAEEFRSRHRLDGVVLGQMPVAVIDGRVWPLYRELDGYRLVEIRRDSAVFQKVGGDARIVLILQAPGQEE